MQTVVASVWAATLSGAVKPMKKNSKIALCAVCAALSAAFMLTSYFPYLTYTIPAISGLFIMLPLIEISPNYAFASYLVSALISVLVAEPEAAAVYVCLLGYYPILKYLIEKIGKALLEWAIKIVYINVVIAVLYFVLSRLLGISMDDFGTLGKYGGIISVVLINITFVIYDIAVSRMSVLYMVRLHERIKRILK